MKLLKTFLIVLAVLTLVAFLLPREIVVARSVIMQAPAEKIFPFVNSPRKMAQWSPWELRDPDMVITYAGAEVGKGAISMWKSETERIGSQEIIESKPNERVVTMLDFGDKGKAEAQFILRALPAEGTHVTWGFTSDMGYNPIMRWMGNLLFDKWIGKDYQQGLRNLKKLVEK